MRKCANAQAIWIDDIDKDFILHVDKIDNQHILKIS